MTKKSAITAGLLVLSLTACDENLFDSAGQHHVRVYQDDQAISCADTGAISVKTHGELLIDEDIELHCAQKGDDGMNYPQSCGSQTGSINIFTIHDKDLATAESLGFSQLSTFPDAQFDKQCEFKVISDARKNDLLSQLADQYAIWQTNNTSSYQFQFNLTFSDCPTFAPTPKVTITVTDDAVNTVYDMDNETFLTDISDYLTIDELYSELKLQLQLNVIEAGLNASETKASPVFSAMGLPEQYFINTGSDACDAASYTISDLVLL